MSHQPWTKEEAEAMAYNAVVKSGCTEENDKMRITDGFYACLAWAEVMIEECETIKYTLRNGKVHTGSYELWEAKLVGPRVIERDEK